MLLFSFEKHWLYASLFKSGFKKKNVDKFIDHLVFTVDYANALLHGLSSMQINT